MFSDPRKIADTTSTPLAASGIYVGPWVDGLKYRRAAALYDTDSATTILWIQHAVAPAVVQPVTDAHAAAVAAALETPLKGRYVRLVIQAGATQQTRLSAQLILS